MSTITQPSDLREVRAVAINLDDDKLLPYIEDAEKQDVLPVLGAGLYMRILDNPTAEEFKYILDGGVFNDGRVDRFSRGLRVAVAYLAYARLLTFGDIQVTAYGSVLKTTAYSQRPGEAELIRAASAAKKMGAAILAEIAENVAVVEGSTTCKVKTSAGFNRKFTAIKKHIV